MRLRGRTNLSEAYLSAEEQKLIRSSFKKAAPRAAQLVEIFYDKLFDLDSTLRPLFASDISVQRTKLASMLTIVVDVVDKPDVLLDAAEKLGQRHAFYGVSPDDFEPVGQALIYSLGEILGDDFTYDVETAWGELYGIVSKKAIQGLTQSA